MGKVNNIPIILDFKGNPEDEWPKIHEAIIPAEAVMNITSNTVIEEHQHSTHLSRSLKRSPVTRYENFLG